MSQDDLAYEARAYGAPSTFTGSWISALKSGKRPLAPDILEGIAGALGVEPTVFAEYRLGRELSDLGYVVTMKRAVTSPVEEERLDAAQEAERARRTRRGQAARARRARGR